MAAELGVTSYVETSASWYVDKGEAVKEREKAIQSVPSRRRTPVPGATNRRLTKQDSFYGSCRQVV